MNTTLDNVQFIKQHDPQGALAIAASQYQQTEFDAPVWNGDHDNREITNVVVTGMGGSALAALLVKTWLAAELTIPFEVVRDYTLPKSVNRHTLVIASSYSGNTEETISALEQAEHTGAQLGIITSGGKLADIAGEYSIAQVCLPGGMQPRMAVFYNLRALIALLETFGVVHAKQAEVEALSGWLGRESAKWTADVPGTENLAKQLAEHAVGKSAVFYGGPLTAPVAYKWKISWNENAKNVAFWNELPEFNHNEFMGWVSHPIEKPFAIFDIRSSLEHSQVQRRFEISDRLLSGKRPHSRVVDLQGDTLLAQLLWGSILADFTSIYLAILNGVDPTPVALIEKLKHELV